MSDAALTRLVHRRRAPAGNLILDGEHDPGWIAVILSGVVKLLKTAADGRRQIVGLQFPGQFVGRPGGKPSPFLAEAASDVDLCCFAGSSFETAMRENRDLEHVVMHQTLEELDVAREWMFVLGRKTAQEKVASLLLLMAHHLAPEPANVPSAGKAIEFELPLSRTEMAEYLGLTIETVSRQISNLKAHGVISIRGARVVSVPDLAALADWSENNKS
jgi:CRP/FNR family transcriptional regulator